MAYYQDESLVIHNGSYLCRFKVPFVDTTLYGEIGRLINDHTQNVMLHLKLLDN
jgi:hypothetical protein